MVRRRFPVTFAPSGITVWAEEGATVLAAARSGGIIIPAPCGGRGVCCKCAVRVLEGAPAPPDDLERAGLKLAPQGVRLACLLRVAGPLTVRPVVSHSHEPGLAATRPSDAVAGSEDLLAAIDLGTTTVGAVVLGHDSGRELGRALVANSQASWGSDIVSRLSAAISGEGEAIAAAAEDSILAALTAACGSAGACLASVRRIVIAGNTAMGSLLLGLDVSGLVTHPFEMPFDSPMPLPVSSRVLGSLDDGAESLVVPPIGSFVGGDVVAGMIAAGLIEETRPVVYVDAGTNAEMAVVTRSGVTFASAAAGPAFEGFGVGSGGVATVGGVTRVRRDDGELHLDVIGGGPPRWFTGSGLISALQVLRSAGHLGPDGALRAEGPLADRISAVEEVCGIELGVSPDGPLLVTQTDVRSLQTAKAAVASGLLSLVRQARVKPRAIERWVVTGAFGAAVSVTELVDLGILPADAAGRVEQVPDATLVGAAMIALDPSLLDEARQWLAGARHVSLAEDETFRESFIAATALTSYTLEAGF